MAETTPKTTPKKAATKTATASAKAADKKPVAIKATVAVDTPTPTPKKTAAAKATAVSAKPEAKKPVAVKPTVAKPAAKSVGKAMVISDAQRYRMVAEAAYYRAESNQFKSDSVRDWIEAESDIAALLSGSK